MSALVLLRAARAVHDSPERMVARDLLLERGYCRDRIALAFAPYSPKSFDRFVMQVWPDAIAQAHSQRSKGARDRALCVAIARKRGVHYSHRDGYLDITRTRELLERSIESCVARRWLTRSKTSALCITRAGRAAGLQVIQ